MKNIQTIIGNKTKAILPNNTELVLQNMAHAPSTEKVFNYFPLS
jgi:hypothetical protein